MPTSGYDVWGDSKLGSKCRCSGAEVCINLYNWDVATIPQCAFIRERALCGDMFDSNRVICSSMLHWGGQQIGVICGSSCELSERLVEVGFVEMSNSSIIEM